MQLVCEAGTTVHNHVLFAMGAWPLGWLLGVSLTRLIDGARDDSVLMRHIPLWRRY